jgi:hypothetical protein
VTLYHSTGIIAASGGAAAKPGMVLLTPTSIAHSGTSASIGANGQVTFTAVTSLSLNGVFSATYDNYLLVVRGTMSVSGTLITWRLRLSGTDATGNNYSSQELRASSTSVTGERTTNASNGRIGAIHNGLENGIVASIYGPYLAQPTAIRGVNVYSASSADMRDLASTHSLSTSYDGLTLLTASSDITGTLAVYGIRG